MAEDFGDAAGMFTEADFGAVDCPHGDICDVHNVSGCPLLNPQLAQSTKPIPLNSSHTMDAFCDFVESFQIRRLTLGVF
jgi:hypothetical protein